jgi:hypothetical protein
MASPNGQDGQGEQPAGLSPSESALPDQPRPRGLRANYVTSRRALDAVRKRGEANGEELAKDLGKGKYRTSQYLSTLARLGLVDRARTGGFQLSERGLNLVEASGHPQEARVLRRVLQECPDFSTYWGALTRSSTRFGQTELAELLESRFKFNPGYAGVYAGFVMSWAKSARLCRKDPMSRKYIAVDLFERARGRLGSAESPALSEEGEPKTLLQAELRDRTAQITEQLSGLSHLWNVLALYLSAEDEEATDRYRQQALLLMERYPLGPAPHGRSPHHRLGRDVLQWSRQRLVSELESRDRKALRATLDLMERVLGHLDSARLENGSD